MSSSETNRRTFRFKPSHDVLLLREISRQRPWTAAHGETMASWDAIGSAFNSQLALIRPNGPEIDPKACQRRYKALIDSYLSGDLASLRSTGTMEEVNEREQLIADLHQVAKDYRSDRTERRQSRGTAPLEQGGFVSSPPYDEIPPAPSSHVMLAPAPAVGGQKRGHDENGSPAALRGAKKPRAFQAANGDNAASTTMAWDFLTRHLKEESNRRQQELQLAEQKLELEKQRFELEKRERECHISTMNAQLDLIKQLVHQLRQQQM